MMNKTISQHSIPEKLPGIIATALFILTTSSWTFWDVAEMYYEGWWGAWYNQLPHLVPAAVCLALTILTLKWPRFGGWLLIIILGSAFSAWWLRMGWRLPPGEMRNYP